MIEPNEAEVETVSQAIYDEWLKGEECGYERDDFPCMARAALSAAIPILTKRIANEIAERIEARALELQANRVRNAGIVLGGATIAREYGEVVTDEQEA